MEVISLNSTTYIGLSSKYAHDETTKFDQDIYYTEQGVDFPLTTSLANTSDNTINNFSNLFLTQSTPISSSIYIEDLEPIKDNGFTTYLAVYATGGTNDSSQYMVVQEPDISVSTAAVSMSGRKSRIDNRYMFTVTFIDDILCKIEHVNENIVRYLTVDAQSNIFFSFDTKTDSLGDLSPQLFYYTYDKDNDFIVFSKNQTDTAWYLTYDPTNTKLILTTPLTGRYTPYSQESIFACTPRPELPNDTKLIDPWVSYKRDFKTNTQNINTDRSTSTVYSNLLLHNEYTQLSGDSLPLNALSLKNTNTPENYQSRNNPFQVDKSNFLSESDIQQREYTKLFTGSNQTYGNDNITLGYNAFTTDIVLPADQVTYFHVPESLYPFKQINVNDSGLIQAGAIAGDHPIKSDKIFKKLVDAKNTSPFGSATDEVNGSFLCSWLSGATDVNIMPVWVDRYYNPSKVSSIAALTSRSIEPIYYKTVFEGLVEAAGDIVGTDDVFDKPSDLVFEGGTYYMYHHYGNKDVKKYIQTLLPFSVNPNGVQYMSTDGSTISPITMTADEYFFEGNQYAVTGALSSIQDTNQFTIAFDMYNQDWSKPFGNQILGNLVNDGFGMFNQNVVTPTIFFNSASSLNILNTDLVPLKTIQYTSEPLQYIRSRFAENYSVVFKDGYLRQYTCDDILLRQTFSPYLSTAVDITNDDTTAYVLCSGISTMSLLQVNLQPNTVTKLAQNQVTSKFASTASWSNSLATTVDMYNSVIYFTPGSISRRIDNTIYYLTDSNTSIVVWDEIDSSTLASFTTAFKTSKAGTYITDFNVDFDGNIWIMLNQDQYFKYTQKNELLLSGTFTSNTLTTSTVYLTGDGIKSSFNITNSGSLIPSDYTVSINNINLRPIYDYTLQDSRIVFVTPIQSADVCNVTRTQYLDTYKNYKICFVSEFANKKYSNNVLFTRRGMQTVTDVLTSYTVPAYQLILQDTSSNLVLSTFYAAQSGNTVLTNTNYLREYVRDAYPTANLNVKAIMSSVYDSTDQQSSEIIFNLSALDTGYHHFAVRFDTYHGYMALFIDGQKVDDIQFAPRKYKFSNLLYRPFLIGTSCFNNSLPLFEYLKKTSYLTEDVKIKNLHIYSAALNDYDIIMHAREGRDIQDIHFDIACGRRNYTEEIERYFKATIPGSKSTLYNITIRNTGITNPALKAALEKQINTVLTNSAPVYSKLNTIKWAN